MSQNGPIILTSTSSAAFRETGENVDFRRWLQEVRSDMTQEARRQVMHYARKFLDLLGTEAAPLVEGPPVQIRHRLSGIDLPRHGIAPTCQRHLLRAGAALHAAVHDLDPDRARQVMDRRTPQRPGTRACQPVLDDDILPPGDWLDDVADARGETPAAHMAETCVPPENLSEVVRPVVEAVNHALTAQLQLDDAVDVRAATRGALAPLSAHACLRIAAELPHAADCPVILPVNRSAPTPAEIATEAIVAVVEHRHADLRPA